MIRSLMKHRLCLSFLFSLIVIVIQLFSMDIEEDPLDTDVIVNTLSLSHKPGNFLCYATRDQNARIVPRSSLDEGPHADPHGGSSFRD